ncbi:class IV lanthionine synthetase LanL [Cystobacter fuscus]|uniref:class IV lanthionine synthetase LanL n=1 Tax=Cystobacter fuscus TaxID=43 RepID=UPI002B2B4E37|nr:protein kinase/lanthionine synthetase C family protein [Cystobacter fuscus]
MNSPYYSLLSEACARQTPLARWKLQPASGHPATWLHVEPEGASCPQQGWKLHLSASSTSAELLLRKALPVLICESASFKVAASPQVLRELNDGLGGLSQVGKFVTIYPENDGHAVRLATQLHEATRGLPGPEIPSDRALKPDSRVFYRYASFGKRHLQTPLGELMTLLEAPDGSLVPDRRQAVYHVPEWTVDPFQAAGVASQMPPTTRVVAGRYALLGTLYRSSRSMLSLAIDLQAMRRCVLKQVSRAEEVGPARLWHEYEVLQYLAPSPWAPIPYQCTEDDRCVYLAMEDIEGETLSEHVQGLASRGVLLSEAQIAGLGLQLAAALDTLHERALAHGDLKSSNVLITPDERVRLIDFELAHGPELACPVGAGRGTLGYMSPRRVAGAPALPADDIYALGALLYFMATAAEPSLSPAGSLLARPLSLLTRKSTRALVALIARCLEPAPERRFSSVREVAQALQEVAAPTCSVLEFSPRQQPADDVSPAEGTLARRLGDTLVHEVQRDASSGALFWHDPHAPGSIASRDINLGSAGILLTLAAMVEAWDDASHRAVLAEGALWLQRAPRPEGAVHPGLYVGEAGVGLALLRAGLALKDWSLVRAAIERGALVAAQPWTSPDLFNGTAGRARFHLELWQATGEATQRQAAITAGDVLLRCAQPVGMGGLQWPIPEGYEGLSGSVCLGYAHGAAGIGDTLLHLYEATGDERFLEGARGAGRWLREQAQPALDDGCGRTWPSAPGRAPHAAFWCHGAAGIGKFFLNASLLHLLPEAGTLAEQSALTVSHGTRWASPVQCHGLAGNIEFLLDLYQVTRQPAHLHQARQLAQALRAFCVEKDGHLYCSAEMPLSFSPAYMVGYAGVAACLLRLTEPEHRRSLLDLPSPLVSRSLPPVPGGSLVRVSVRQAKLG